MLSFDVTSLFTNVPIEFTIDIILHKVHDKKLVHTNIPKKEMKELSLLCTKNVHFSFNNKLYQQLDGVAMGSPSPSSVIAGIFMVELETTDTFTHFGEDMSTIFCVLSKKDIVILFWRRLTTSIPTLILRSKKKLTTCYLS